MPRNKHAATLLRRRTHRAGDLPQLLKLVWQALVEAEAVLLAAEEPELTLKACHAIAQSAAIYARLLEAGELETRLAALEAQLRAA
jgi:hypothetical protein